MAYQPSEQGKYCSSCCHASAAVLLDGEVPAHVPALLVEDKNRSQRLFVLLSEEYIYRLQNCARRSARVQIVGDVVATTRTL